MEPVAGWSSAPVLLTFAATAVVLVLLAATRLPTELVLLGAMILLTLVGVITPDQALSGFGNPGVWTIAALYVVVAGLRETGALTWASQSLFGRPRSEVGAQGRLMLAGGLLSPFVNNTPVVAMFIPVVQEWAARFGISISKLLLPFNNVVILAGTCTLIGTSTNLVVNGLLTQTHPEEALGLFDLAWVGVPLTLLGIVYSLTLGRRLLPDRPGPREQLENAREYSFEVRIHPNGPLVGRTIAEVGLRNLKSAYVLEIQRGGRLIAAVGSEEVLRGDDCLTCVGIVDAVKDLRRIPGLSIAEEQTYKLNLSHAQRILVELVLSRNSPLVGQTVRETGFRTLYNAAIISISRDGARLPGKLGDIELQPGDTLLVEAGPDFVRRHKYNREFLLVSPLQDSTPHDFRRAPVALGILGLMIIAATLGALSLFEAAFVAAGLMIATRCVTTAVVGRSIEYPIIVGIAASYALGVALSESGAAQLLANLVTALSGRDAFWSLCLVYFMTVVVTEIITNNAAGVLMFPIAIAAAELAGANHLPFVVAVMIAASAGFVTPIGYQTNLMIYGPGGYRFMDFVRFGVPLSLITAAATVAIVPQVWPF